MPVLAYCPQSRMAVMDGPLGPVETELSSQEDWPSPLVLDELGRYFVKCFGDVPDSVRQAPFVIQAYPDNLLRAGKLVDLYKVVREALRVSEPSYSIKNIENFYLEQRTGDVQSAGASIVFYERWKETNDPALLQDVKNVALEEDFVL